MLLARPRRTSAVRAFAVAALVIGACLSQTTPASAHDSEFCGHYTLTGRHWRLTYEGYRNYWPNTHYHFYHHEYDGLYQHQRRHTCGQYSSSSRSGTTGTEGVFLPDGVDVDVPANISGTAATDKAAATQEFAKCMKDDTYGWGLCIASWRNEITAVQVAAALRTTGPLDVVMVQPSLSVTGERGYEGLAIPSPLADQCVLGVWDAHGARLDSTAELRRRKILEVADRSVAANLGHAC